ncbi:MAG: radical SAM protein [Pseudobdellovibrionaceae bacterium]
MLKAYTNVELKRYKDIVAFKSMDNEVIAFHSKNLEVAEISDELWQEMPKAQFSTADQNENVFYSDNFKYLQMWSAETNPDVLTKQVAFKVNSLTLNVTQICNLQCTYCAAGGDGTFGNPQSKISIEKTLPQLDYFLKKINSQESFHITFLGGEPLLYKKGIELVADHVYSVLSAKNAQADFSIVTNGVLVDDEALRIFKKYKFNVTVSIDGPEDINEKFRPSKNKTESTKKTVEAIKNLSVIKDQIGRITLHGVFHKENLELFKAYEFYTQFDADTYDFTYAVDNSDEESSLKFINQMQNVAAKAWQIGKEKELLKIGLFQQYFSALDQQMRIENHCAAGKSYLMIDAKNQIFTCPWDVNSIEEKVGHGLDIDSNKINKYAENLIEKNKCQDCWARFLCGGGCMFAHKTKTGNKNIKDPIYCMRTRMLLALAIQYYFLSRQQN